MLAAVYLPIWMIPAVGEALLLAGIVVGGVRRRRRRRREREWLRRSRRFLA